MLLPLFHASVVVVNSYALWYDQKYLDLPFPAKEYEELSFKGRSMFLTVWCLILQTVYFSLALIDDITKGSKIHFIQKLKDYTFSLAFPTAIYVVTGFWIIYFINKDLIFPDWIETIVPFWVNAVMHIFVAIFIIIELIISRITYPPRKIGIALLIAFNYGYLFWMHILHKRSGKWPYPLFEEMNLPVRVVFFIFSMVLGLSLYVLGEKLCFSKKNKSQLNGNGVKKLY